MGRREGGGQEPVQIGWIPMYIGLICAIGHGEDGSIEVVFFFFFFF